jgi:hypothetical protein
LAHILVFDDERLIGKLVQRMLAGSHQVDARTSAGAERRRKR